MTSVLSKIVRLIVSSERDNLEIRVTSAVIPQSRNDDVVTVALLRVLPAEVTSKKAKLTTLANTQQCIISRSTRRDSASGALLTRSPLRDAHAVIKGTIDRKLGNTIVDEVKRRESVVIKQIEAVGSMLRTHNGWTRRRPISLPRYEQHRGLHGCDSAEDTAPPSPPVPAGIQGRRSRGTRRPG